MVNIKKINDRIDELKISKAQLIKDSGLTRVTIDKILKGGEVNVSTLEALAKGLGVTVGFFFDEIEEVKEIATSGNGGASATGHAHASVGQNQAEHDELIRLREEVKYLKQQFADRDKIIETKDEMIDLLKSIPK
uniref:HTH cro/C1-type domain-containing protein n=1 Tax=Dulem virus 40 TaxID=3145758 RepID=A0AAU8AUL4_9CAUD